MADPATGATTSSSTQNWAQGSNQWLTDMSAGLNLVGGLERGGAKGYSDAATSAAKLGSNLGVLGKGAGSLAADVTNLGNIVQGIQQGGFRGYTSAAVNAAALGARTGAFGAASAEVGQVAGALAIPFSLYNFAKSWQSGATGADALSGAQTGATIGSAIPVVGTLAGAAVGAAVGAVSSIFGPGREDPENVGWNEYAAAYDKSGANAVSGATASQNFEMLAGIFDSRGSSIPFYQKYGRMGENAFMTDMTRQINGALASGKIAQNSTPQQIYNQVVEPWINSMSPGGWQASSTVQGAAEKGAVGNMLTNLIGQWQAGQITNTSKLGIAGQTVSGLEAFGSQGSNPQAYQQQQSITQQVTSQLQQLVAQFPMGAWGAPARMK